MTDGRSAELEQAVADARDAIRDAIAVYDTAIEGLTRRLLRLRELDPLVRPLRLDVMDELVEGIRSGRLKIVGREDYVVNGRKLAKLQIEGVE